MRQGAEGPDSGSYPGADTQLRSSLFRTYAELLRRQRTASNAFVRWSRVTHRSHDFVWLGPEWPDESLMHLGKPLSIEPASRVFESVQRMYATARLNPYEREVLYGYPYLIGRLDGKAIRGPLLALAAEIEPRGGGFVVRAADDRARFNSLPFRTEQDTPTREAAIGNVIAELPPLPLTPESLRQFVDTLTRELTGVRVEAKLDGHLGQVPDEPTTGQFIALIDQAALFVAPKTSYFLTSDLENMAASPEALADLAAMGPLIHGAKDQESPEFTNDQLDSGKVFYPLPSNRSQRRVALLIDDPRVSVVRVEGPPGTGKSLTLANLACHLAATERSVLITSQKDKALEVVDRFLRELNRSELPMTLLRQDTDSKRELRSRIEGIRKDRSQAEVAAEHSAVQTRFVQSVGDYLNTSRQYAQAVEAERLVERAHRRFDAAGGLRRLGNRVGLWRAKAKAKNQAPQTTDIVAEQAAGERERVRALALEVLRSGMEKRIASATQLERQKLRELSAVLRRDQTRYSNFSLFDSLKAHPDWASTLLRLLPVWIVTPDDAARLFPCMPGLFDLVIVDEASQVDLPSITPILVRGKKAVIVGDTKQMQPRRFAFLPRQVAQQAWRENSMERVDPHGWFDPLEQSLLLLGAMRAEEENLLDEHFRSLPPIIEFSNRKWYGGQLRVMTDERRKKFGPPRHPTIQLHRVEGGQISNGSQENDAEAQALVEFLARLVSDPDYSGASIGVLCLFEEQVALLQDVVAERIDEKEWDEHDLVVVNPDGFQGDERDIVLYSLSWDNDVMPRQALSQRQREAVHEQGMLNVMFTRARDEIHVFHSAPIETFTKADGSAGALTEWLFHCRAVESNPVSSRVGARSDRVDSEFEGEVAEALRQLGVRVLHQYPCSGFHIDLVCERDDRRIAVECDGDSFHKDEHGRLRTEDIERQAILERAGWTVVRVPYRRWLKDREAEVRRITETLNPQSGGSDSRGGSSPARTPSTGATLRSSVEKVSPQQHAILEAVRGGLSDLEAVLRKARASLGHRRLGALIRASLMRAITELNHRGLLIIEDGELFITPKGRTSKLQVVRPPTPRSPGVRSTSRKRRSGRRGGRPYRYRRYY